MRSGGTRHGDRPDRGAGVQGTGKRSGDESQGDEELSQKPRRLGGGRTHSGYAQGRAAGTLPAQPGDTALLALVTVLRR